MSGFSRRTVEDHGSLQSELQGGEGWQCLHTIDLHLPPPRPEPRSAPTPSSEMKPELLQDGGFLPLPKVLVPFW